MKYTKKRVENLEKKKKIKRIIQPYSEWDFSGLLKDYDGMQAPPPHVFYYFGGFLAGVI